MLAPTLAQMAERENMGIDDQGPDGPLVVTHWENPISLDHETHWRVWLTSRGVESLQGTFFDRDAGLKYIVMMLGREWRRAHRYPAWYGDEVPVTPGTEVRRIEWAGGWAELPHGYSGQVDSAEYRLLVNGTVDEVLASYGDPHGRPLFRV